jgi:hypothetical protein
MNSQEAGENCVLRSSIFFLCTNIIVMIKSRRMRAAGHAARMGKIN